MFVCLDREHREVVIIIRSKSIGQGKGKAPGGPTLFPQNSRIILSFNTGFLLFCCIMNLHMIYFVSLLSYVTI